MPTASIDLACRPTLTAIPAGQERTLHVLIRVRAGVPEGKVDRPRLSAVLALDVSGSMHGQPIEHVIRSSERIVDLLAEGDAVGVVAFSSEARVVAPLRRLDAAARRRLQGEVRKLQAEGGTNISAGMSCGASLFPPRSAGEQQILLLLSDGQPNVGPSTPRALASEAGQIRARNIAVSTLGYGAQHDENVLINIAELGGGRYAFVSEPQLAEASFVQALGTQLDVVLEGPRLVLTPSEDADIVRVLGDLRTSIGADGLRVALKDLVAGDEINVVVEVRVRAWREGDWRVLYATLSGQEASGGGAFHAQAQASFTVHSGPELADLEALAEVGVALADEQRTRARGLAARRDFAGAVAVLQQALRAIEATPGFQRGKGDPLDDAYDALLDDRTIYEQKPSEERSAHYFKAQQDFLSLSSPSARKRGMSPNARSLDAKRRQGSPEIQARLVIEAGAGSGNTYTLGEGRTVIGRGSSCDVSIPTPNLSRQHALIERLEDAFWLVDMGSTNGVRVRGRSVQRHELQPGDVFELGDVRIRFERG
jgi:Mg-chelatase subunit ChlD